MVSGARCPPLAATSRHARPWIGLPVISSESRQAILDVFRRVFLLQSGHDDVFLSLQPLSAGPRFQREFSWIDDERHEYWQHRVYNSRRNSDPTHWDPKIAFAMHCYGLFYFSR